METIYLTRQGLAKLEAELRDYEQVRHPAAARALEEARKQGDLAENAEYDAAREEIHRISNYVQNLKEKLSRVQILDEKLIGNDSIRILNKVHLKDLDTGKKFTYVLVSPEEMDIEAGKISVKSPVGRALLGKREGEIAEFTVPAGPKKWKVIKIEAPEI